MNTLELDAEQRSALELSQGFGVDYGTVSPRFLGNHNRAVDEDIVGNGRRKRITGLRDLRAEVLIEPNANGSAAGKRNNGWWRRGRRRRCLLACR
jgi:hypothetical protein